MAGKHEIDSTEGSRGEAPESIFTGRTRQPGARAAQKLGVSYHRTTIGNCQRQHSITSVKKRTVHATVLVRYASRRVLAALSSDPEIIHRSVSIVYYYVYVHDFGMPDFKKNCGLYRHTVRYGLGGRKFWVLEP